MPTLLADKGKPAAVDSPASATQRGAPGCTPSGSSGPEAPVTVTALLNARSMCALEVASRLTGDTLTDSLNKAIQVYAFLRQHTVRGAGSLYLRRSPLHEMELLRIY